MSELAKLFIKYCPIFYFYKDEPYMPCDFEDILNIANIKIEDLNTIELITIPKEKRLDTPVATQILCKTEGFITVSNRTYIDLVYIIIYAWNGTIMDHVFDKEEAVIRLQKNGEDYEIVKIFGSSHGYGKWWPTKLIKFDKKTNKPYLYSANESHALYNEPRIYKSIFGFGNDACSNDIKWTPTEFVLFENDTVNIYDINMNIVEANANYFKYPNKIGNSNYSQAWPGSLSYNTLDLDGFYKYIGGIDNLFTGENRKVDYKYRYLIRIISSIILFIFLGYLIVSNVIKSKNKNIVKKILLFILQIFIFGLVFISSAYIGFEIFIISPINKKDINKEDKIFASIDRIITRIIGY
jgi:hypothetical protein